MPKAIINIGRYNGTLTEYTKEGQIGGVHVTLLDSIGT
jgi:hypothetical protein